jgi:hypothetical protein
MVSRYSIMQLGSVIIILTACDGRYRFSTPKTCKAFELKLLMAFNNRIKMRSGYRLFHEKTEDFPGCGLPTRALGSPLVVIAEVVGVPLLTLMSLASSSYYSGLGKNFK